MLYPELNDTHPAIDAIITAGYRAMSPQQKMERVRAMTFAVQELALHDIRKRHPDAAEREVALRMASRWLDGDTMRKVFGWDPDREGY